jgi:uracil-DNA glycosylase
VTLSKQQRLDAIAADICAHVPCGFEPCESCATFVPGEGAADARVVLVGEAPGANEDREGRPFVGAAGRFLDTLLAEAGLSRSEIFITNVLKSRPPGNRDPRADEVAHSWPWLEAQLAVIEPEVVVPLGRHALARFDPAVKIADVHGRPHTAGGRSLFPLYHPAAALHGGKLRGALISDARALGDWLRSRQPPSRPPRTLAGERGSTP